MSEITFTMKDMEPSQEDSAPNTALLSSVFLFLAVAILLFYFPNGLVLALVGGIAIGLMAGGFKVQDIL